ncbi:MAG: HAD family hydrolase [Candidatus Bathyarchaeota archaeon]
MNKKYSVVVFDMDGTLIKESCWELISRHFNLDWEKTKKVIEKYYYGEIGFNELLMEGKKIWGKNRFPHITQVEKALSSYTLMKNAKEAITKLKNEGYLVIMITYGLDILAKKVAKDVGIEHVYANELELDKEGYFTGKQKVHVKTGKKLEILMEISKKSGIPLSKFIVVGDSKYDLEIFNKAGFRIALNPKDEEIKNVADVVIRTDNLLEVTKIILSI